MNEHFLVIEGNSHECMIASDVVLASSGTSVLEAALLSRPAVAAYKVSSLLEVVNVYAQNNDFDMVLADGVIYASTSVNITSQILESLQSEFEDSEYFFT